MTTIAHHPLSALAHLVHPRTPHASQIPQPHGRHALRRERSARAVGVQTPGAPAESFRQIRAEHEIRAASTMFLR